MHISYKIAHLVGKSILYLATELVTLLNGEKNRAKNWASISQILYGSLLGNLKVLVRVNDLHIVMRPFSEDASIISDVIEQGVYDTFHHPSPSSVVIDVGAHIGLFTLKVAKVLGKEGIVVAIEPYPENFKLLKSNIALFQRRNKGSSPVLLPQNIALGSKVCFATLFLHKGFPGHSSITMKKEGPSITVPMTTLDNLIMNLGIKRVDFVKIDVEGSELEVLKGARKTLEANDRKLSMEIHGEIMRKKVPFFLKALGYNILQLKMEGNSYTSYLYAWK